MVIKLSVIIPALIVVIIAAPAGNSRLARAGETPATTSQN